MLCRKKFVLIVILIAFLSGCAGKKPAIFIPPAPPPTVKLAVRPRVVVVLGSGGARGYAHLGVLQALQGAHIPVDALVCASAGCVVGALYADNQNPRKTYDIMMRAGFWDFADIANFPSPRGIIEGYHLEKFLLKHMQARTFRQLKIKLIIATTDLKTGQTYPIASGPVAPAALASSALPGAVQPVRLYGHQLIDGGVSDPVPVNLAKTLHPEVIIAINIARQLKPAVPILALHIYSRAYSIMWQHLTDASLKGADIIIRPKVGEVGTFDIGKKYQMYLAGFHAGKKAIPRIKQLLNSMGTGLKA